MRRSTLAAIFITAVLPCAARAAEVTPPMSVAQDTVEVVCADRQGSGALTKTGIDGSYVVTAGHVAIDPNTGVQADECRVGFVSDILQPPRTFFGASVVRAAFDAKTDRDFAVLKLGNRLAGNGDIPPVPLKTDEFAGIGDPLNVLGYPTASSDRLQQSAGKIDDFWRGTIRSDAAIGQGYSGGPAVDASGNIVGVADRITYSIDPKTGGRQTLVYDMGDVINLIAWLDGFGTAEHDKYLTHADPARFDGAPYVFRDEKPGCVYVVRTVETSAVYCLLERPYRLVFPDAATFYSWYPDASGVEYVSLKDLAEYRLIGNVTMRAGSLVKITTDSKVYVVTDSLGTLRWVQTEERARTLFGAAWASKVRDLPDVFFVDYRVGQPVF